MNNFKRLLYFLVIALMIGFHACAIPIEDEEDPDGTENPTEETDTGGQDQTDDDTDTGDDTDTSDDTGTTDDDPEDSGETEDPPIEDPEDPEDPPEDPEDPPVEDPAIADTAEECLDLALASTAIDIGINLPTTPSAYEPSGADWHTRLNMLFSVHDNGAVFMMDKDGNNITTWSVTGDLEAVTIADPESDFIYLGREWNPTTPAIMEFNIETGEVTRTFDLSTWITGSSSAGLEALTFVEIEGHPEGGQFWAGHQGEGKIYVFELPIVTSSESTTVSHIDTYQPVVGRTDLSGLDYNPVYDVVFAIYDSSNKITIVDTYGDMIADKTLPKQDQEGIAVTDLCEAFIAQDTNKKLWYFPGE